MLRVPQSQFLGPEDLAICQRVFDQICADAMLDRDSTDSQALALTVLTFFQRGAVDHDELLAAVLSRLEEFTKPRGEN
ncbi:hypothetical protein EH240_33810 [Mesorhizobium tamadayense]|uniref:Uncharacterized protein n=1 Tax=Mesorhizobium tamadayense TaxID=425306 RepID=A0A3P3ETF9_9HYPH|nr:hypothetical protein EH240_33810 [Mesorhizobium tamadayense]